MTKRDIKISNEKSLIVDNKIDVNFRHKCERFYEDSQDETRKFLYTQWIYDNFFVKERYVTHHYVHRVIFRVFFNESSISKVKIAILNSKHDANRQTYDNAQ